MEVGRVIDAHLNRLTEGVRVIEDTLRYFHNDVLLSSSLKNLRHQIKISSNISLLSCRNVNGDVLKGSVPDELQRENLAHLVMANFKRAQESARVLEEYTKLVPTFGNSADFKKVRYELYELEKTYFERYGKKE